ncbi:hypothetical protein GCM10027289_05270 [Tsukamurella serpentis]
MIATPEWNDSTGIGDEQAAANATAYGDEFTQQRMSSYLELAESTKVLGPAAKDLGAGSAADLRSSVTTRLVTDSVMLDVGAVSDDPQRAADIANAVARRLADAIREVERPTTNANSPVQPVLVTGAVAPARATTPHLLVMLVGGAALGSAIALTAVVAVRRGRVRVERVDGGHTVGGLPLLGDLGDRHGVDEARARLLLAIGKDTGERSRRGAHATDDTPVIAVIAPGPAGYAVDSAERLAASVAATGRKVGVVRAESVATGSEDGEPALVGEPMAGTAGVTRFALGMPPEAIAGYVGSSGLAEALGDLTRAADVVLIAAGSAEGAAVPLGVATSAGSCVLAVPPEGSASELADLLADLDLLRREPVGAVIAPEPPDSGVSELIPETSLVNGQ